MSISIQIFKAIIFGRLRDLRLLLRKRASQHHVTPYGVIPSMYLFRAVIEGNVDDVTTLLDYGIGVDIKDDDNSTPLHCAVTFGHVDVIDLLLKRGAAVGHADDDGLTPLHCAARLCSQQTMLTLIAAEAPVGCPDVTGKTPLHWIAMRDEVPLAMLLLTHGAPIDAKDNRGDAPVHLACRHEEKQMAFVLIAYGADSTDTKTEDSSGGSMEMVTSSAKLDGMGMCEASVHARLSSRLHDLLNDDELAASNESVDLLLDLSKELGHPDTTAVLDAYRANKAVDDMLDVIFSGKVIS